MTIFGMAGKLLSAFENFTERVGMISVALMVILVLSQIVARYFFGIGIVWAEELSTYLNIVIVFLTMAYFMRLHDHVSVSIFYDMIPRRQRRFAYIALHAVQIFVSVFFVIGSISLINQIGATFTPGLRMSLTVFIFPAAIGFSLLAAESARQIYKAAARDEIPASNVTDGVY